MQRKKVLLPLPDGPITATTSDCLTLVEIPFRTCKSLKRLCRSTTSILVPVSFILHTTLFLELVLKDINCPNQRNQDNEINQCSCDQWCRVCFTGIQFSGPLQQFWSRYDRCNSRVF